MTSDTHDRDALWLQADDLHHPAHEADPSFPPAPSPSVAPTPLPVEASNLMLGALMDNIADHIYFKDPQSRFVGINRSMANSFGLKDPADAIGKRDFDFFSREHAESAFEDEQTVLRTGQPIVAKEEKETWPNRQETWVSTTKMPWYSPSGELLGTFGLSRDITARKKAEEALMRSEGELRRHRDTLEETVISRTRELSTANEHLQKEMKERARIEQALRASEQRYRRLLGATPTYVYTVHIKDGAPTTTEHSIGCVLVTGYTPEEYVKNPNLWITMVHPDDRDLVRRFVVTELATKASPPPIEHRIIQKDGTVRWVRNTVVHYFDERGRLTRYDGLVEDITERRRAEELVRDSERLKAIGNLADGVAANFKTIMGIIAGSATSISDNVIPNTPPHQEAVRIIEAAKHAGHLIRRLMSVARACDLRSTTQLEPVSVGQVVKDTVELVEHSFTERNIRLSIRNVNRMPSVQANADQMMDTIMNLLMNAAEAMPNGGAISVYCKTRRISNPLRGNPDAKPGTYAILSIRDTGAGIPKETLTRIFDPFFTTKASTTSFGLGLTVSDNLVRGWSGWLTVHSRVGVGTVFRIFVPVSEIQPAADAAEAPISVAGQTVLLIDDDTVLLHEIKTAMEHGGLRVLSAATATDGIDLYMRNFENIAVTVTDMVLPGTPWPLVLENILRTDSQADIIVTSGFSRDFVRRSLPKAAWGYLQKPFEPAHLVELVTETIRKRARHKDIKVAQTPASR